MAESWPSAICPQRATMGMTYNNRAFTSSLSNAQQIVGAPGAYWACSVQFSVLTRQQERVFTSLVGRLRGMLGTINVPDFTRKRTDSIGAVVIVSAPGYSASMVVGGITSAGLVFREGDRITAAGQLYEVVRDVEATAGQATLPLNRLIRSTISPGTPVEYQNPYCEMRLTDDRMSVDIEPVISSSSLEFREAF